MCACICITDGSLLFLAHVCTCSSFTFAGLWSISWERRDIWKQIIIALLTWGVLKTKTPPRPQKLAKKTSKSKIFILFTFYANQTDFHKKVLHQEVTRKWPMRMYAYFLKDHSRPQRPRSFWSAPRRHDLWVNTGSPRFNHCVIN